MLRIAPVSFFSPGLRPELCWGAHDTPSDPLVSWEKGYPHFSPFVRLRRVVIGACSASAQVRSKNLLQGLRGYRRPVL